MDLRPRLHHSNTPFSSLVLDRSGADPLADIDHDAFGPFVFRLVVRRAAQLDRGDLFGAGSLKTARRLLVAFNREADVVDPLMFRFSVGAGPAQRQHGDVDRAVGEVDGAVLPPLSDLHSQSVDEKVRHGLDVRRAVRNVSDLTNNRFSLMRWILESRGRAVKDAGVDDRLPFAIVSGRICGTLYEEELR